MTCERSGIFTLLACNFLVTRLREATAGISSREDVYWPPTLLSFSSCDSIRPGFADVSAARAVDDNPLTDFPMSSTELAEITPMPLTRSTRSNDTTRSSPQYNASVSRRQSSKTADRLSGVDQVLSTRDVERIANRHRYVDSATPPRRGRSSRNLRLPLNMRVFTVLIGQSSACEISSQDCSSR